MPPLHFYILMLIFIKPNKTEALKKIRKPFSMGCECGEVPNDNEYVERHCHESAQLESHHKAIISISKKNLQLNLLLNNFQFNFNLSSNVKIICKIIFPSMYYLCLSFKFFKIHIHEIFIFIKVLKIK